MPQVFGIYMQTIMERGAEEAQRAGSATIEAEHLLLAIAAEQESTTQGLLGSAGLDYESIRNALEQEFRQSLGTAGVSVTDRDLPQPQPTGERPSKMGESAKLVLERGTATASRKKDLRPVHLLLGILQLKVGTVPRALAIAGVDQADLRARAEQSLPDGGK